MRTLTSYNPSTQRPLGERSVSSSEEIQEKVRLAHVAKKHWADLGLEKRATLLKAAYRSILAKKNEFAQLIHDEMGKTLTEAQTEVTFYCGSLDRVCSEITKALSPQVIDDGKMKTTLYYDPLGVGACISPWNFPFGMPHTLIIPTLMAGNPVCFKPSEETFLIGEYYTQILQEFLPENVIQLIIGDGEQGKILVESNVQIITFTGSISTGKKILNEASKSLKRVVLELGGKDPLIILDDGDLKAAAKFGAHNSCRNAGQVCVSTEQIFVLPKQQAEFEKLLVEEVRKIEIGPMIHSRQKQHIISQIDDALNKGAKILYGVVNRDESNFLSPIVLTNCTMDMDIIKNETFGPVACIVPVKNLDQAIEFANQSDYGLGGSVFSANIEKAQEIARRLETGMVGINRGPGGALGSPWVGAKQSGYGHHGFESGHRQFAQLRTVNYQYN